MVRRKFYSSFENAEKSEKIIRQFAFDNANFVRLTKVSSFNFFEKIGGNKNTKFLEIFENLRPFYVKKIINNKLFNDIEQAKKSRFEHYFFKLDLPVKKIFKEESILFDEFKSKNFYGFADPTFYIDNEILVSIITHEPIVILYLTDSEKSILENKTVIFDEF
jgi:hypothetical protein